MIWLKLSMAASLTLALAGMAGCDRDPERAKWKNLEKGNSYFERGRYREASILYRNALKQDLKFGEAYYRLALADLRMANMMPAVRSLRRAISLLPDGAEKLDAKVKLADLYLEYALDGAETYLAGVDLSEEREVVEMTARELVRRDPRSFDGHRMKANLNIMDFRRRSKVQDAEGAREALSAAIVEYRLANETRPLQPNLILSLARSLVVSGRPEEAEGFYRQVIERDKTAIGNYLDLVRLLRATKRLDEAEKLLRSGIGVNPKSMELRISLAALYRDLGRSEEEAETVSAMKTNAEDRSLATLRAAEYFFSAGDLAASIRELETGVQEFPKDKGAFQLRMIEAFSGAGRVPDAVRLADELVRAKPLDADAVAARASLLGAKAELEAALPAMETVLKKSPDHPLLRYNLGRTYALRRDWETAQSHFTEALRLKPDFLQAALALGEVQYSTDKFESATAAAEEVLERNSRNRAASILKVRSLIRLNRFKEARQTLNALIAAIPMADEPLFHMGLLNMEEKKYEQAEQSFAQAYSLNPRSSNAVVGLVQSLEARKRFDLISAFFKRELAKFPDRRDLRILFGQAAVRAGSPDLAISEYTSVLNAASGGGTQASAAQTAPIQILLGEAYEAKGDHEAAMTSLERARVANPADASVWLRMGKILDATGRKQKARECYEQVLKLDPENVMALNELAFLLAETNGDLDLALTYAQRAKQKLPLVDEFSDTLGWIYLKKQLSKSALEIFEPLAAKEPARSTYRYHLGAALLALGETARAQKELQAALRNNPSREEAGKIRELMGRL